MIKVSDKFINAENVNIYRSCLAVPLFSTGWCCVITDTSKEKSTKIDERWS